MLTMSKIFEIENCTAEKLKIKYPDQEFFLQYICKSDHHEEKQKTFSDSVSIFEIHHGLIIYQFCKIGEWSEVKVDDSWIGRHFIANGKSNYISIEDGYYKNQSLDLLKIKNKILLKSNGKGLDILEKREDLTLLLS